MEHITINGTRLGTTKYAKYIDRDGTFKMDDMTIKPSGSVRIGDVKIHPSGLIQVRGTTLIDGCITQAPTSATTTRKVSGQSTSRSALNENTNTANRQPKKVPKLAKDVPRNDRDVIEKYARETMAQSAGSKRKSIDTAAEPAKRQRRDSETSWGPKGHYDYHPSAPEHIDQIDLEKQWDDSVPVYDNCDEIRRKIKVELAKGGISKARFCRELTDQFYSDKAPKNIQSKMLDDFLRKDGASHGCTSSVYYGAYCYFEKYRLLNQREKSEHRIGMERAHKPFGMPRDRDVTNRGILYGPGGIPHEDEFGRWSIRHGQHVML